MFSALIIKIIIKVFIKHKILSVETILSVYLLAHSHTQAPAGTYLLSIQSLIYTLAAILLYCLLSAEVKSVALKKH